MAPSIPTGNVKAGEQRKQSIDFGNLIIVGWSGLRTRASLPIGACPFINRQQELSVSSHLADKVLRLSEIKRSL
jgi:hypothetical protein